MTLQELDQIAVAAINALANEVRAKAVETTRYEGAIEGVKFFMQEIQKKVAEVKQNDSTENSEEKA